MRFTMTREAAARLGLSVDRVCGPETGPAREFDGPSIREGLLGGFPRGVIEWLKRQLKVDRTERIDLVSSRLAYYALTMRSTDHTLLPFDKFDDLSLIDFRLAPHPVTSFDQDGDCGECARPLDDPLHLTEDGDEPGAGVPPTTAPVSPGTTGTGTISPASGG